MPRKLTWKLKGHHHHLSGPILVFQGTGSHGQHGTGMALRFPSPKEGSVGRWTVWNDFQEYSSISSEEEDEAQPSSCHSQCKHLLHVMYVSYLILWNISVKHVLSCPVMSVYEMWYQQERQISIP